MLDCYRYKQHSD